MRTSRSRPGPPGFQRLGRLQARPALVLTGAGDRQSASALFFDRCAICGDRDKRRVLSVLSVLLRHPPLRAGSRPPRCLSHRVNIQAFSTFSFLGPHAAYLFESISKPSSLSFSSIFFRKLEIIPQNIQHWPSQTHVSRSTRGRSAGSSAQPQMSGGA